MKGHASLGTQDTATACRWDTTGASPTKGTNESRREIDVPKDGLHDIATKT